MVRIRIMEQLNGSVPLDSSSPIPCNKQSWRGYNRIVINPIRMYTLLTLGSPASVHIDEWNHK